MSKPKESSPARRTSPPRPDQLTDETVEFLTALDLYKRKELRSFLRFEEIFPVLEGMGYTYDGQRPALEKSFEEALEILRSESGRLFPSWSEIFEVALDLGWER